MMSRHRHSCLYCVSVSVSVSVSVDGCVNVRACRMRVSLPRQGMKSSEDDKDKDTKDGVLATFLVRVKEEVIEIVGIVWISRRRK